MPTSRWRFHSNNNGRGDEPPGSLAKEEHLLLEFRDGVQVYVPASKIDLVQ